VIGLAPSAAAAATLADAVGVPCENTAKGLYESRARVANPLDTTLANGWGMRAGQLVIVDEASLASTPTLVALLAQAKTADAKLLLVGDHHQLPAVEAGGAFGLLARKTPVSELVGLWRFRHRWEAHATRDLRHAHPTALDTYARHGRLHDGPHAAMLEAAYQAWLHDRAAGLDTLLLAGDNATVTALNARARTDRILTGQVTANGVALRDGTTAGTGDVIVTDSAQLKLRL
jgi:ATP-dependent exoDNAse (exonuclease V) alpha subunit